MLKIFNILKANEEVKNLTAQVEQLTADNKNLLDAVETYKQKEAAFGLGSQEWASEKETLIKSNEEALKVQKDEYEKTIAKLQEDINKANASASEKAKNIVASIGVEPETVKVCTKPNDKEIIGIWKTLSGQDQMKYYQEHRDTILKELGMNK